MDPVELKTVLEGYSPAMTKVFTKAMPAMALREFDKCVVEFLLTMLEAQGNPDQYLADELVVETIKLYLTEFEVCKDDEAAKKVAEEVVSELEKSGFTRKPIQTETRLNMPLSIGKAYEDTVRKASSFGLARVVVNTNDQWTWDAKRETAKDERKKRKEDEKKAQMKEEYDEFLRKRGVQSNQAILKLHHKGDVDFSTDIRCPGIHIRMGKQVLLDDTDLNLLNGHKYGLVGRNGAGKTTLLRALSERELEGVSPFVQILHVEQEITGTHESPLQLVLNSDIERMNLLREEQELLKSQTEEAGVRLAAVYERLDFIDAHVAEARAAEILHGLSFTTEMMTEPTSKLSGGWRMRVALARALFVEPEILLLDEPTNHLDLHACVWLEEFLQSWQKTLVVVSHSRAFLNAVTEEIIHLENHKLSYYTGNYDQFEITRCENLKVQSRQFEAQEKQRAHMQSFIDKFRYSASHAKMAQSRIKALERMEKIAPVIVDAQFSFRFPEPEPAPTPYLQIIDCEYGYKPGESLFSDVNFGLDDRSRVVLCGANGAGKSTFMNMCLGHLEPRKGQVIRNQKIRIGHFAQHHLEYLTPQLSSVEFMRSKFPHADDQFLRGHLGSLGLSGDKALQPIYTLSGGQKSRLALAWITYTKPHLLMLDEPTNHLDIDTVNALLQALLDFPGGIMVVSHDEHFITSLCEDIYVCADGKVGPFNGDFLEYKASIVKQMRNKGKH